MRIHPRMPIVDRAGLELSRLVWAWMNEHDLTYVEAVRCLLGQTQELTKFMLRHERHPDDSERKADEA
jgi:hypothetical protein